MASRPIFVAVPRPRGLAGALRSLCGLVLLGTALWLPGTAHAALPTAPPNERVWFEPSPEISVLTFGPGDEPFLRFGHNAIRVRYPGKGGADLVYNFGTFRFDHPLLILDFLTGKFEYWLSVASFNGTLAHYKSANRSVTEQVLAMSKPNAWELAEKLRVNALPENRAYLYDYYRDNCSTRVRDAIDGAIGNALQQRTQTPGSLSLRDHTLRLVADDFWLYVGLDIAMGPYIDQPETRWSEMFLPEKLEDGLSHIVFSGAHGTQALVKKRQEHFRPAGRPLIPNKPPYRTLAFLQGGVVVGALMAFLAWEATRRRQRWAQAALAVSFALFGVLTGILGLLFTGLWALTNHVVTYHNENILQCAPWGLGLSIGAWGLWKARLTWLLRLEKLTMAGLAASLVGLIGKALPIMEQHNERIIALFLPIWIGAFVAIRMLRIRQLRLLAIEAKRADVDAEALPEEERQEPKPSQPPPSKGSRPPPPEEEEPEDGTPSVQPAPA